MYKSKCLSLYMVWTSQVVPYVHSLLSLCAICICMYYIVHNVESSQVEKYTSTWVLVGKYISHDESDIDASLRCDN